VEFAYGWGGMGGMGDAVIEMGTTF
jgi:hypothetical protein